MINLILIIIIGCLIYRAIKTLKKTKCGNCSNCQNCNLTFSKQQKDDILSKNRK